MGDVTDIGHLAELDPTDAMSTRKRKKVRKAKRDRVGYDRREPELCQNCAHFQNAFIATSVAREYFPPRCNKHKFQVERLAVCDHWDSAAGGGNGKD